MSITAHVDHGAWTTAGRCVYCECGERLYQGRKVPATMDERRDMAAALDALFKAVTDRAEAERPPDGRLFDPGPGTKLAEAGLSQQRLRTLRRNGMLANGIHPATKLKVRPDLGCCRDCAHAVRMTAGNKSFWKCQRHYLGMSHSEASDIAIRWPACEAFKATAEPPA